MTGTRSIVAAVAALLLVPAVFAAQVQQGTAGRVLKPTASAAAAAHLAEALDRNNLFDFHGAVEHARAAFATDPSFGLAQDYAAWASGGPSDDIANGAALAARTGSAAEALITLAMREDRAGHGAVAAKIGKAAADLVPDDARVATWAANLLADSARVDALRAVTVRFPEYVGGWMWLAYYATPVGAPAAARSNADEAMHAAQQAERLAPTEPGPHVAMAHVLTFTGHHADAKVHLDVAARMSPMLEYAYWLRAQGASYDRNMPAMRAALDSAIAASSNAQRTIALQRDRALVALEEGNPKQALAELGAMMPQLQGPDHSTDLQNAHVWMAYVAAAAGDSAATEGHLAAADAAGVGALGSAAFHIIAYSLIHNGAGARKAHDDWARLAPNAGADFVHRYNGLTLLADRKAADAEAELRQDHSGNPYGIMGLIESLRMQKKTKDADAVLAAFNNDHAYFFGAPAVPMIRYRALRH